MTSRRKYTHASLDAALRRELAARSSVSYKAMKGHRSAEVEYVPGKYAKAVVDPMFVSIIRAVLHELVHVLLDDHFSPIFAKPMHEQMVEAVEDKHWEWIVAKPARGEVWRRAIERVRVKP